MTDYHCHVLLRWRPWSSVHGGACDYQVLGQAPRVHSEQENRQDKGFFSHYHFLHRLLALSKFAVEVLFLCIGALAKERRALVGPRHHIL
jgi:hypothetical protein